MKKGEGQSQPMEKQLYSEKTIRKSTRPTKERKK